VEVNAASDNFCQESKMGAEQIAAMEPSLREVYEGVTRPDDPPTLCCTLEATNLSGSEVWIQVMPGTVNMAYPLSEEPPECLRARGIAVPEGFYLVDWKAGEYATFGFDNLPPREHASFVDRLFVNVLGCDDAGYEPKASMEQLET
jgi:hypothetical protein